MCTRVILLAASLLIVASSQPLYGDVLGGPLGLAKQASLTQVDILTNMISALPVELQKDASKAVSVAQRAHKVVVRNVQVVERGVVTRDYRRWKLRRAIRALERGDRKRAEVMEALMGETPPQLAALVSTADQEAHAQAERAVLALHEAERKMGGSQGAGTASKSQPGQLNHGKRDRRNKSNERPPPPPPPPRRCG